MVVLTHWIVVGFAITVTRFLKCAILSSLDSELSSWATNGILFHCYIYKTETKPHQQTNSDNSKLI